MIHIEIVCAGRLKEPYWAAACAEYEKRLTPCAKLHVCERPEGRPLAGHVPAGAYAVALCVEGEMMNSEAFARMLREWMTAGRSSVCFLIGGSDGLFEEDKARADRRLSLSRMTFPHHMARALLLEQLYRAFQILGGGKYHK